MHRIYFDENAGDDRDRCDLGIPGLLADIAPIAEELSDGLHVILYDEQELKVEVVLEFEPRYNRWMARALWEPLRRLNPEESARAAAKWRAIDNPEEVTQVRGMRQGSFQMQR